MDKSMRYLGVLLFVLASSCCLANSQFSARKPNRIVDIKDKDLKDLSFWCETPDEMIGDRKLQPGQGTNFRVYIDQLYVCHFKCQSREKDAIVFNNALNDECVGEFDKDCIWEVRKDGFWFLDIKNQWVKKYDW